MFTDNGEGGRDLHVAASPSGRDLALSGGPRAVRSERDHGRAQEQGRRIWDAFWSGRHLQPARGDGADHLPALHPPPRRAPDCEGEQGEPPRQADRERRSSRGTEQGRVRDCAGRASRISRPANVRGRRRPRLPVPARARRRRLDLLASHAGRALHDPDAGAAREGRRPDRRAADGGPRHQGRRLRVHAQQDRHRRPERPVPHAAPHHPADGRDDRADAEGRDLRPRLRHRRLPGRRRRVPPRDHPEDADATRSRASTSTTACSTASTSTARCCASAA